MSRLGSVFGGNIKSRKKVRIQKRASILAATSHIVMTSYRQAAGNRYWQEG